MISYSPNHEDVLLERCFRDVSSGFYVDIGACHPTHASVTRWFYDRGWHGINIEPGDGIQAFRLERPRDINIEAAVSDFDGEANFFVHESNPGTSSLSRETSEAVLRQAGAIRERKVQVVRLPALVDRHIADRTVQFLKIDAEGAENAIITSTDWRRFRPEVLVIESTEPYTNIRRAEPWQELLQVSGYDFAYFDGINDFWIRSESIHLKVHFAIPVNVLDKYVDYSYRLPPHMVRSKKRHVFRDISRKIRSSIKRMYV